MGIFLGIIVPGTVPMFLGTIVGILGILFQERSWEQFPGTVPTVPGNVPGTFPGTGGNSVPGNDFQLGIFPFFLGITVPYKRGKKVGIISQEHSWEYYWECSRNWISHWEVSFLEQFLGTTVPYQLPLKKVFVPRNSSWEG